MGAIDETPNPKMTTATESQGVDDTDVETPSPEQEDPPPQNPSGDS